MEKKNDAPEEHVKPTESQVDPLQAMTELAQRTQANFENYRKQTEKRVDDIRETAAKNIILHVLPIVDNLELALKNVHEQSEFVKGIELIYSQLFSTLEAQGVKIMSTEKGVFDPYFHEALLKVESDLPENTILEEFQKGYLFKGQVLRHAKVKISAGSKNKAQAPENQKKQN
ncbi:MAG: nucleotide exchange factor GrpE [Nanoarchaeota archaeon]|nr:nucleotide exchange factor GrpE [Nanoarchaeota archaeon]